jgi:short-subunit dehydrogenase
MTTLQAAHVLITGASRGVGHALARAFASRGSIPTLVARDSDAVAELARELDGTAYPFDLTMPAAVAGAIGEIEDTAGPIDILVNNAGVVHADSLLRQDNNALRAMVELNLLAPMELCRQVLPRMVDRGHGHVVNISSLGASGVFPGLAVYSATKAGLAHFTAGLRADLRGLPVRTTLVDLGPVPTDALAEAQRYRPAADSYRRAYRTRSLVDVPRERVATAIVSSVEHDRRHVRIPRRAAVLGATTELPRRLVELLLTGINHQPDNSSTRDE